MMLAAAGGLYAQDAAVAAPESNELEIGAQFGFESHYVFRGKSITDENMQATVNAGCSLGGTGDWGFRVYGEFFYEAPFDDEMNEVDWKIGGTAVYADEYYFDAGYIFRTYPNSGPAKGKNSVNRENELFLGIARDVRFWQDAEWSQVKIGGTVSYDWNFEQISWEFYAEKTFEEVLVPEFSVNLRAVYGYITMKDANGDQWLGHGSPDNDYGYCQFSVDGIYSLNKTTDVSAGMRYAYNNDHIAGEDCNEFWWGVALRFRY